MTTSEFRRISELFEGKQLEFKYDNVVFTSFESVIEYITNPFDRNRKSLIENYNKSILYYVEELRLLLKERNELAVKINTSSYDVLQDILDDIDTCNSDILHYINNIKCARHKLSNVDDYIVKTCYPFEIQEFTVVSKELVILYHTEQECGESITYIDLTSNLPTIKYL